MIVSRVVSESIRNTNKIEDSNKNRNKICKNNYTTPKYIGYVENILQEMKTEWNARIFTGMSRTPNLVFDQIECIIHEKLDLMRNALPTDKNIRIQSAWRVNNVDS